MLAENEVACSAAMASTVTTAITADVSTCEMIDRGGTRHFFTTTSRYIFTVLFCYDTHAVRYGFI